MKLRLMLVLFCLGLATGTAQATITTYSGFVNDQLTNAALVDSDLGLAQFVTDNDIASTIILLAIGFISAVTTDVAAATARPALVNNTDEPGRTPYEEHAQLAVFGASYVFLPLYIRCRTQCQGEV